LEIFSRLACYSPAAFELEGNCLPSNRAVSTISHDDDSQERRGVKHEGNREERAGQLLDLLGHDEYGNVRGRVLHQRRRRIATDDRERDQEQRDGDDERQSRGHHGFQR